jgi:hypothetical protein
MIAAATVRYFVRRSMPLALTLCALGLSACNRPLFGVNFFIVGEQTSLEKQVLGTYGALGEDLLLYSSVRGVDEEGNLQPPPPRTESQEAAFAAMRNRDYNRDDVDAMLVAGLLGEARSGMLEWRDRNAALPPGLTLDQAERVVEEENRDRAVVLERLMATVPGIDAESRGEVERIFAGLNREMAPAGAWVQADDGSWSRL